MYILVLLKFTPLEFETVFVRNRLQQVYMLKFTPLEFETYKVFDSKPWPYIVKIYSVGV